MYETANRGTPEKDNPVPSIEFEGEIFYPTRWDKYYASKEGNILSLKQKKPRVVKPFINNAGYKCVSMWNKSKDVKYCVHAIIADTFLGERQCGYQVDHIDNDKLNNRLDNLQYLTRLENSRKANCGSKQHDAKTVYCKCNGKDSIYGTIKEFRENFGIPKWHYDLLVKDDRFPSTSKYKIVKFNKGATTIEIEINTVLESRVGVN